MSKVEKVEIVLRSAEPTKAQDLKLQVPQHWTVGLLKDHISQHHPRRPHPSEQVLIYHGKVLNESEAPLEKVLRKLETEGHHTMHLVFRGGTNLTSSESLPNLEDVPEHPSPPVTSSHTDMPPARQEASGYVVPQQTSPMVAVPVVMVNPIVNAAYNAALAAVYQPKDGSGATSSGGNGSTSGEAVQNVQQPMVPAIAFFPLGIPVLVPGNGQQQGFQVGQNVQPSTQQGQQQGQRRQQQQPMGRRGLHGGLPARRGVVVYRFSLRGLIQLALIVAVLYAYCSKEHFVIGMTAFVLLYLFARPIRRRIHQHYHARDPDGRRRNHGILHEIFAVLLTLISSLFPNWNANEGDGAPFARVVREALPEDRAHVD